MKISNIRDAPLLRAYLLINQEKNKKGFKAIQPEISKMSEVFGNEFDRNLHLTLFNDIDFKDLKSIQNSQNPKKRKIQYFLQDFPQFIERSDFIEIFSRILMDTKNTGTTQEIFNGLNKICKLNIENQMKLILSFFMSDTDRYQEEAKTLLLEKCKEIFKEKKLNNLTESTVNTLLTVLDIVGEGGDDSTGNEEDNAKKQQIEEYTNYFMSYEEEFNSSQTSADDIRQISDLDKVLDSGNEDPIEIEKLFYELGPFILNNKININNSEMINSDIDIERLGNFIIFMLNHPSFKMDDELKELNRIFLETLNTNSNTNENKDEYKTLLEKNSNKELMWDLDALYKLFKKNVDGMDTNQVLNSLDDPSFCIKEKKSFDFLIEILTKLHILKEDNDNINDKFFKNLIFTKWNNEINQIEFIDFLINNKEISENSPYGLRKYNGNKIPEEMDSKIQSKHHNSNAKNQYLIDNWRIIDLIEILLNLSKGEFYNSVKEIFKWPIQNIPELLSLVLVNIVPEADAFLYDELTYEVIPQILTNKNTNQELINEIWNTNKDLVILIMAKMWDSQQELSNLNVLFDIATTKLKDSLPILLNSKYYNFSVNLGIYASKRENINLNLEQWIKERINKIGDEFIEALLHYIKINVIQQCTNNSNNKGGILEKAQLSMESLGIILDNIFRICNTNKLSQKTKNYFQEIYKSVFEIYDYLQVQPVNSEEIEKETNQIYKAMFDGEISVDNVINKLINYKKSTVQKENEIYALVIHYLFDEYRFYYQYPEKEIKKIAELFGKAINNKLIDGIIETIALKFIIEGIKTGKGAMYNFGINALSQFIGKISHWPNFMNSLIDLPQIKNEKELYQKLLKQFNESKNKDKGGSDNSRGEEGEYPLVENEKNVDAANNRGYSADKDDPSIAKQYDNLRDKLSGPPRSFVDYENLSEQSQLPEEIINKIRFIFGSLNKNNLKEKVKELKPMIKDDKALRWFSQYFVTNKLNAENNSSFQLYDDIFTQIENKDLNKVVIKDTISYTRYFLFSESSTSETKTKELLKSLGNWLGIFIIKKNRPILAKDLDFKELIFNSYVNGKLLIIIPFICRVFSYTAKSKVFHYKNPWINAILCLLSELYSKPAIDNSIKEEIKSLFKTLEVDFSNIGITKDLDKLHIKISSDDFSNTQNPDVDQELLLKKISDLDDYINNLLGTLNSDPKIASRNYQRNNNNNNTNNNNDNLLTQNTVIKILTKVMVCSLQQAIPNIIDLYVNNPIKSAIAIVNKDFMFEANETKYISALDNTMKTLVKSLSVMGSREKLKSTIDTEFTKLLRGHELSQDTINKIIWQPNSEYLYIGLDYIQNYIKKEAPKILHEQSKVKEEIEKRRQSNNNNSLLMDSKRYKEYKKFFKKLPSELQPNEKCITDNVYKVYENFGKIIDTINIYEDSSKSSFLNTVYRILKEVLDNTAASKARCNNRDYDLCMKNIENVSHNTDNNCEDDTQLVCLEKIIIESKITDVNLSIELSLNTLEYAINSIKSGNILLLNVYSHILKGWVKLHNEISYEITKYLLAYEDIFIKYKLDLHLNFYKKKIINFNLYEAYFIDLLNNNETDLLAKNFLKQLFNYNNINIKASFPLLHSYYYDENSDNYYALFSNKSKIASHILEINTNPIIPIMKHCNNEQNNFNQFRDISTGLLDQLLFYYRKNSENFDVNKMRKEMKNLFKNDVMAEDKIPYLIFFVCETCIKGPFEGQKISRNICFPENVSLLIYIIIYAIKKEKVNKTKIFNNILNAIVTFFHKDYIKSQKNFNQRAYYKLFYNLIYLLDQNPNDDPILDSEYKKIHYLLKICDMLRVISPVNYPGFTMAWLDLISSNHFASNFLEPSLYLKKKEKNERNEKYLSLIIDALNYLDSFSDKSISNYNYVIFLEAFYKFFFILCNSCPDFVSNYYYLLITSLTGGSSHFLQLKNIILSATPSNVTLPTIQLLNINLEEEDKTDDSSSQDNNSNNNNNNSNSNNNSISSNNYMSFKKSSTLPAEITNIIEKNGYKELIDKYINDYNENYLVDLVKSLENIEDEKEINKIFNAIVIYWGLSKHKRYTSEKKIKSKEEFYSFYSYLINHLNENHRDILIHALLNALRFPCQQTASYSLLYQELFAETKNEEIEEHLLNNLLERLLYKPYPWGLKYTMVNLFEKEKFHKIKKNYAKKNDLVDVIEKISVKCFENNLENYCSSSE